MVGYVIVHVYHTVQLGGGVGTTEYLQYLSGSTCLAQERVCYVRS